MFAFYLFVVSFFGLLTFYLPAMIGVGGLTHVLAGTSHAWELDSTLRSLSLASVSALIWWVHWRMLTDENTRDKENLLFLQTFLASAMLAWGLFVHGTNLLTAAADQLLGLDDGAGWLLLAAGVNLLITLALWVHHVRLFRRVDAALRSASAAKAEAAAS